MVILAPTMLIPIVHLVTIPLFVFTGLVFVLLLFTAGRRSA
jgi:uncharacterized protein involved in cysteine biosynthesis